MIWKMALAIFPLLAVTAAVSDITSFRIPNWLTAAIAICFAIIALAAGMPKDVLLWHLLAGGVALLVGFVFFLPGFIGGGDAKLIAVCSLWIGWDQLAPFIVYTAFAGGALAAAYLVWNMLRTHIEITSRSPENSLVKKLAAFKHDLPYGAAIAVGACAIYPHTWWLASLH